MKEIKVYLAGDFAVFVPFKFNYATNSWKEFLFTVKDCEMLERAKNSKSKIWNWAMEVDIRQCLKM